MHMAPHREDNSWRAHFRATLTLGVPLIGIAASVVVLSNRLSPVFLAGLALVLAGMVAATSAQRNG